MPLCVLIGLRVGQLARLVSRRDALAPARGARYRTRPPGAPVP